MLYRIIQTRKEMRAAFADCRVDDRLERQKAAKRLAWREARADRRQAARRAPPTAHCLLPTASQ